MEERLILERDGGLLRVTLNRPEKRNAFDEAQWRALRDTLAEAQADDAVHAVLVTGSGAAFTAGQDLAEMGGPPRGEPPAFPSFMERLCRFDKPLLAAVNGVGVGIGLTFLLHCDIVWIAEGARLRAPFVTLGVVPEAASSFLLPQQIGWQRAAEILYTAEWIDAPRAVALGIASRMLPAERLLPEMCVFAARIAAQPLGSLRGTRRLLLATRAEAVRAALEREHRAFTGRVGSAENLEAVRAFFEKRPPDFRGVSPADREA